MVIKEANIGNLEELSKLEKHINLDRLKQKIDTLNEKLVKIEDLVIEGTFNKNTYVKKSEQINQEIINAETILIKYENQYNEDINRLFDYCMDILNNLSDFWLNSDIKTKVKFENFLFPEGLLYEQRGIFRTPVTSYIIKSLQSKDTPLSTISSPRGVEPLLPG